MPLVAMDFIFIGKLFQGCRAGIGIHRKANNPEILIITKALLYLFKVFGKPLCSFFITQRKEVNKIYFPGQAVGPVGVAVLVNHAKRRNGMTQSISIGCKTYRGAIIG